MKTLFSLLSFSLFLLPNAEGRTPDTMESLTQGEFTEICLKLPDFPQKTRNDCYAWQGKLFQRGILERYCLSDPWLGDASLDYACVNAAKNTFFDETALSECVAEQRDYNGQDLRQGATLCMTKMSSPAPSAAPANQVLLPVANRSPALNVTVAGCDHQTISRLQQQIYQCEQASGVVSQKPVKKAPPLLPFSMTPEDSADKKSNSAE